MVRRHHPVLAVISNCYSEPKGRFPRVTHPCATRPEGLVRLACVRHAASVRSEPGSNSQVDVTTPCQTKPQKAKSNTAQNFRSRYLHFKRNGYEGHTDFGLIYTAIQSPKTPGSRRRRPHVPSSNQQCQRTTDKCRRPITLPRYSRGDDCPSIFGDQDSNTGSTGPVRLGGAAYMERPPYGQLDFAFFLQYSQNIPAFQWDTAPHRLGGVGHRHTHLPAIDCTHRADRALLTESPGQLAPYQGNCPRSGPAHPARCCPRPDWAA